MEARTFEDALRSSCSRVPFQPFAIELANGERLQVYEREALMFCGPTGMYFAQDGEMTIVDCENVKQIG